MFRHFNKYGNIEIVDNILKYRIGVEHIGTDDIRKIESELKQKYIEVEKELFISPMQLQYVNRFLVLYFNVQHLKAFDYLREQSLLKNIPYFISLVDLAIAYENGHKFTWERLNFVVDEFDKTVKIILPETNSLKVYNNDEIDVIKAVKDMILSALTMQNQFLALPKRHDFIDASEENVLFVEQIYKLNNLEDIQLYLETVALELEQKTSFINEASATEEPAKKSKKVRNKQQKTPSPSKTKKVQDSNGKKPVKRLDKNMIILFGVLGVAVIIYAFLMLSSSKQPETTIPYDQDLSETFKKDTEGTSGESDKLLAAYRYIHNSEVEEAYKIINSLSQDEISVDDVQLIIDTYFRNNKSAEMLDKFPNLANNYVTYLISNGTISQLETFIEGMQTENPYILFELAALKSNYEDVILYKDQVEMNARREGQVVDAYIQAEKYKEALEFARGTNNPDLITLAENAQK